MKYGPHSSDTRSLSPFFIGLIGHRELREDEIERVQKEFDEQIHRLLKKLKSTRIIVLTSLAEGADRIVQKSKYRDKLSVCAVLPFSKKEYEKDFPGKKASSEFRKALSDSDYVINFPGLIEGRRYVGKTRDKGYRDCARWISDNSNLLIVIWDGKKPGKVGGTGDIVEYRLEDVASRPLNYSRGSGFFHIKASNGASDFILDCSCDGHAADSAEYLEYLNELERLNAMIIPTQSHIEDDQLQVYFKQFDISAVKLQKEFQRRTITLLTLGVITLTFAAFQQITFALFWLLATGGVLAVTLFLWWRLSHSRTKVAFETFRFVAEVLRIQIWWNQMGINRNILHEDIESHDVNDTVYLLLSNVLTFSSIHNRDLHRLNSHIKTKRKHNNGISWIEEQINYLNGTSVREGSINRTLKSARRNVRLSVAALGLAASVQVFSTVIHMQNPISDIPPIEFVIKIIFSLSLAVAAAFTAYEEAVSNREISSLYELKLRRLLVAMTQLKKSNAEHDARIVVTHVGIDALAESLRWFQLKSEREVKPFQA